MKNLKKPVGIISIIAIIVCTMATCDFLDLPEPDKTPVVGDYDIGNLKQAAGATIAAVTLTPKAGKSSGARTIYYEGIGVTVYTKSTTVPPTSTSVATYAVTFDVAAASGWSAVTGLFAGVLTIGTPNPVAGDYEVSGLAQKFGSVTAVTITPKAGKSNGARTIYYEGTSGTTYAKSTTLPSAIGTYAVTFDVAAASGWNAAAGLSAGNLVINDNPIPVASDFDFGNLIQTAGSVTPVTITPKANKSGGARTIYYTGTSGTTYAKSTTLPTAAGTYAVTFDVAAASGWNPATGLSAGNLVINNAQTLSVTIIGTATLGSTLYADVQKNVSGKNAYQWMRGGTPIQYAQSSDYEVQPLDTGKAITVKVTVGTGPTAPSKTSDAMAIPAITDYTVAINRYRDVIYVDGVTIPPSTYSYGANAYSGLTCQWLRNDAAIPGATEEQYELTADDAGKTIKAKVGGYGLTRTSSGIDIPPSFAPAITIEYDNSSARSDEVAEAVAREIQEAYNNNLNGCRTAIGARPWCIDFCNLESSRDAKIILGKLHIYFSMDYYDTFNADKTTRLGQIGTELKNLALDAAFISLGKEYSGNFEDILEG